MDKKPLDNDENSDSDIFEVPKSKNQQKAEYNPPTELTRAPRNDFTIIDTKKGLKHKEMPEDVEDTGLKAKSERKRVRAEVGLGKFSNLLQGDEKFEEDAVNAAGNYSVKRKKKYTYTEDGIPIEPFSVREEQESHIFDSTIVKDVKKDGTWDPWLLSVEEDMKKMEKENALKEVDSDKESEGDDKGKEGEDENDEEIVPLDEEHGKNEDNKITDEEKLKLIEEICSLLKPKETINHALIRLRGNVEEKKGNFKKNIRKKTQPQAEQKNQENAKTSEKTGNIEEFQKLMNLADKLLNTGYLTLYTDQKEDIEFEGKQIKAGIERKNKT